MMAALKAVKETLSILNATVSLDAVLDGNLTCPQKDVEDILSVRNIEETKA